MPDIHIPEPCPEKWNAMTVSGEGRYCDRCCKVVVDFTQKTNEEIRDYFRSRKGERICGHYRPGQVSVPAPRGAKKRIAHFALALYLVFGGLLFTSCGEVNDKQRFIGDTIYAGDSLQHVMKQQAREDSVRIADSLQKEAAAGKAGNP